MTLTSGHKKISRPLALLLILAWTLLGCRTVFAVDAVAASMPQLDLRLVGDPLQDHDCCSNGSMASLSAAVVAPDYFEPVWALSPFWSSIFAPALDVHSDRVRYSSAYLGQQPPGAPPVFLQNCTFLI